MLYPGRMQTNHLSAVLPSRRSYNYTTELCTQIMLMLHSLFFSFTYKLHQSHPLGF